MRTVSAKIEDKMADELERARAELGMSKTEILTTALVLFLGCYRHACETIGDMTRGGGERGTSWMNHCT